MAFASFFTVMPKQHSVTQAQSPVRRPRQDIDIDSKPAKRARLSLDRFAIFRSKRACPLPALSRANLALLAAQHLTPISLPTPHSSLAGLKVTSTSPFVITVWDGEVGRYVAQKVFVLDGAMTTLFAPRAMREPTHLSSKWSDWSDSEDGDSDSLCEVSSPEPSTLVFSASKPVVEHHPLALFRELARRHRGVGRREDAQLLSRSRSMPELVYSTS